MLNIQGIASNMRAAISSPRDWMLSRQSVTQYGAIQHVVELTELAKTVREIRPRRVLEIGTAQGGVFWLLCKISAPDATLISLDLPPASRHSGGERTSIDLANMKQPGQKIYAVHGNSHSSEMLEKIRSVLDGEPLDLLFIDGDHTYDGVREDYKMYGPLVRKGGLIGFHDIVETKWEDCGVDLFWKELRDDPALRTRSIVRSYKSAFGGIGLIYV